MMRAAVALDGVSNGGTSTRTTGCRMVGSDSCIVLAFPSDGNVLEVASSFAGGGRGGDGDALLIVMSVCATRSSNRSGVLFLTWAFAVFSF